MTSICGLGEATLFQTYPVDTLALLGGKASFSCTPVSELCGGRLIVYWQRGPSKTPTVDRTIFNGTDISRNFTGKERYTVSVSDCTWTLRIQDIQSVDGKYYSYPHPQWSKNRETTFIVKSLNHSLYLDLVGHEERLFLFCLDAFVGSLLMLFVCWGRQNQTPSLGFRLNSQYLIYPDVQVVTNHPLVHVRARHETTNNSSAPPETRVDRKNSIKVTC